MQKQLLSLINAAGATNVRSWGVNGVCFDVPHSDDPCYATQAPNGLILVWWARAHVEDWAPVCREADLVDPPEELINTTSHHAYSTADELCDVIRYWAQLGKLPA